MAPGSPAVRPLCGWRRAAGWRGMGTGEGMTGAPQVWRQPGTACKSSGLRKQGRTVQRASLPYSGRKGTRQQGHRLCGRKGCSNHIMQPASSGAGGEHQQRATEQGVARGAQPATMAAPTGPCLSTSSRKVAEKLANASLMGLGSTRLVFLPPSSPPSAGPAVAGAGGGAGCLQATSRTAWIAADTSAGISYGAAEQCGAVQQPRVGPMTVRGAPGPRGGGRPGLRGTPGPTSDKQLQRRKQAVGETEFLQHTSLLRRGRQCSLRGTCQCSICSWRRKASRSQLARKPRLLCNRHWPVGRRRAGLCCWRTARNICSCLFLPLLGRLALLGPSTLAALLRRLSLLALLLPSSRAAGFGLLRKEARQPVGSRARGVTAAQPQCSPQTQDCRLVCSAAYPCAQPLPFIPAERRQGLGNKHKRSGVRSPRTKLTLAAGAAAPSSPTSALRLPPPPPPRFFSFSRSSKPGSSSSVRSISP